MINEESLKTADCNSADKNMQERNAKLLHAQIENGDNDVLVGVTAR